MTKEQYEKLSAPFRSPIRTRILNIINKVLTYICYILYPVLLLYLIILWDPRFWKALLVPAIAFVLLSVIRKKLNRPRPYQILDINPLTHKDTKGKSMPSRHVFCVFMIAMTWLWIIPWMGIILLIIGIVMAIIRVIGGVHFPKDVAVGAAVGILAGIIGYWIL